MLNTCQPLENPFVEEKNARKIRKSIRWKEAREGRRGSDGGKKKKREEEERRDVLNLRVARRWEISNWWAVPRAPAEVGGRDLSNGERMVIAREYERQIREEYDRFAPAEGTEGEMGARERRENYC